MAIKLTLKSGEYFDFYNIKSVNIIDSSIITIKGNYDKGKRYHEITRFIKQMNKLSYKDFLRYLKTYKKYFEFEGCCPSCDSLLISKREEGVMYSLINDPKKKEKFTPYEGHSYKCNRCGEKFTKDKLKYCDIILYY